MDAGTSSSGIRRNCRFHSLDSDTVCRIFSSLDNYFDLARCSSVCKSWHEIIRQSSLWKDQYLKNCSANTDQLDKLKSHPLERWNSLFAGIAMNQHRRSLVEGSVRLHQWSCHSSCINQCRMRMGVILTGAGDKVMRIWSSLSYRTLEEYVIPSTSPLVDFDFDESKIVGLVGNQIYIWKRHVKGNIMVSPRGQFSHSHCMSYKDPEAVIGCGDGNAYLYDMYSRKCSSIIRMHSGPITCLSYTEDQLIISSSSLGSISLADSSSQTIMSLKTSSAPTGIASLCFNQGSSYVFAGSTSGYAYCWDLRTLRPLWERRVSPNVLYSINHMVNDVSTLVAGGIDGVLRVLDPDRGDTLRSYIPHGTVSRSSVFKGITERKAVPLAPDTRIDMLPKQFRPPITSIAVGMQKVVTAHNDKYITLWKFS